MSLYKEYKEHVNWCNAIGVSPIGFVPFKEKKFNMTFNEKTGEWTKNTK